MLSPTTNPVAGIETVRPHETALVGWREWLAIPTLNIDRIKAKIDTGARTSSLHAFDVRSFTDRGAPHVSFVVCPLQRRRRPAIQCVAEIHDERIVMSSSGHRQRRHVIRIEIDLAGVAWPIELTLANRDSLGFRMLLGREAVRNRFVIDPNESFIAGRSYADVSTILLRKAPRK